MDLKRGIDAAAAEVSKRLLESARDVEEQTEIAHVATISAQDEKIGELIAEAFSKVGKDGVITVEESPTMGLELEFTEGLQFDKGYISPYFITDPSVSRRCWMTRTSSSTSPRSPRWPTSCRCSKDRAGEEAAAG